MGRAGPKRKPNAMKRKEGTYRTTRDKGVELPAVYPNPPIVLNENARPYWDEVRSVIEPAGVASVVDGVGLALLSNALCDYFEAREQIANEGKVVYSEKGSPYQHPAVGQMHKASDMIRRMLAEFGMTPSSRSGMKPDNVADTDPLQVLMNSRMN